jgi:hypothetical protein
MGVDLALGGLPGGAQVPPVDPTGFAERIMPPVEQAMSDGSMPEFNAKERG